MSVQRRGELSSRASELASQWKAGLEKELGPRNLAFLVGWLNSIQHTLKSGTGSELNTLQNWHLQVKCIMDLLASVPNLANHDVTRHTFEFVLEYETYDQR